MTAARKASGPAKKAAVRDGGAIEAAVPVEPHPEDMEGGGDRPPVAVAGRLEGEDVNVAGEVVGEPVELQVTPVFTEEQLAEDRSNRKARTAAQAFPAAAFVGLVVYVLLTFFGLDMNVDPNETLPPPEQVLAAGALVTWGIAAWMNREPKA